MTILVSHNISATAMPKPSPDRAQVTLLTCHGDAFVTMMPDRHHDDLLWRHGDASVTMTVPSVTCGLARDDQISCDNLSR